jgi:hypothetical protein
MAPGPCTSIALITGNAARVQQVHHSWLEGSCAQPSVSGRVRSLSRSGPNLITARGAGDGSQARALCVLKAPPGHVT